ncbi:hypothetical protein lerEdw1_013347 [Lerista edwardsae]|nr:hypothetical protein lerEdw1_013347 [Lerista edwardsae]
MKARQKAKRKGASKDRVFGCDLVEHLQASGQDNIPLEFDTERSPDLNKDVYLQDIHCVSSLCKAYFRELPNPLLTYQLYDKFAEAVNIQLEEGRLVKIKEVLKELPPLHYRTLEFLTRHLVHMASFSPQTNMHVRNLAIVWAPNLLRSKDIEMSGFNGTAAFMEVRIQSIVVEFILTHVEQLFGDAPLSAGSRESVRKSLLLMESPMALMDEKCCFSYNVPTMLNQGDGPPQMRPYHTIIELTDSKYSAAQGLNSPLLVHRKKGSLKAKKWKSIFNLGRAMNDTKRKSGKMEDKGKRVDSDKATKMRLRPAKSMDSLSSMPCSADDGVQLGRKKPPKQLTRCRESFDGPASLDSSFLESDECPEKVKGEERHGESEGEATAKSEPTTPKASRSSLVGVAPQGRSPKTGRNRAEKCAGVHISGPFSVTVPFHITATLSRLTQGQECPALKLSSSERENSLAKEGAPAKETGGEPTLVSAASTTTDGPSEGNIESLPDAEKNRISLEVQDSFSFLDSQDSWGGDGLDGEYYTRKNSYIAFDCRGNMVDGFPVPEDDLGSGFMNEMIGGGMELEMSSGGPRMDYLSIEECMNELSEEEEDQYYLACNCDLVGEDPSKEFDSEDVYMSAVDDLSPLAAELEHLQEFADRVPEALPPEGPMEDQPFSLMGDFSPGDPTGSNHLEAGPPTPPGAFPAPEAEWSNSMLDPELSGQSEEEEGGPLSSGGYFPGPEAAVKGEAKPVEEEPSLGLSRGQDPNVWDEPLLQLECSSWNAVPEDTQGSLAPGRDKQTAPPSLEEQHQPHQSAPEVECGHWPLCDPSAGADGPVPETVGMFDEQEGCRLPFQEAELRQSGEDLGQPPNTEVPLSMDGDALPADDLDAFPLLGRGPPAADSDSTLMPVVFVPRSARDTPPGAAHPGAPLPDGCPGPDALPLTASPPNTCPGSPPRKLRQAPSAGASVLSQQVLSDGSVRMRLTANTTRIQHAKSCPVVPPKPQFAKAPPFLTPKTSAEEEPLLPPDPPALDQSAGNGAEEEESGECPAPKPPRPLSLGTYWSPKGRDPSGEILPASSGGSPDAGGSGLDGFQKRQNAVPGRLEEYNKDCDAGPGAQCSPLDKCSPGFKTQLTSSAGGGGGLQHSRGSLPESFEGDGGSEGGGGEPPQQQRLPGTGLPARPSSEGGGAAPQKQRQAAWRNGSSMSFDEAVALAKERHLTQAPVRRMQTYCYGDAEGPLGPLPMEKLPPHPKPALKPLGQRPLRPLSCLGPAGPPEALFSGRPFFTLAPPSEAPVSPTHETLALPQDLSPRRRLSLPKIGRRLSLSEEASSARPEERR